MKSKKISKNIKMIICRTTVRAVVTCGAEVRCLNRRDKENVKVFQRKIITKNFKPKKINKW